MPDQTPVTADQHEAANDKQTQTLLARINAINWPDFFAKVGTLITAITLAVGAATVYLKSNLPSADEVKAQTTKIEALQDGQRRIEAKPAAPPAPAPIINVQPAPATTPQAAEPKTPPVMTLEQLRAEFKRYEDSLPKKGP